MSGHASLCALFAAWLTPPSSPFLAPPPGSQDVERGIELYWSGQYRETVALLSTICEVEQRDDVSIECHKYLAFSQVALGEAEMAQRSFSQLLARDSDYQLDEGLVSPKILEQFHVSRRRLIAELFERGKAAYFDRDYPTATELLTRVVRLDPEQMLAKEYSQLAAEQSALVEERASLMKNAPAPPPPVEEADDRVYHVTSRISPPVLLSKVQPDYPPAERRAGHEGTVVVTAVIGKDGMVRDAKVIRSVRPGLAAAAIDAVRQWRYRPARLEDREVAVYTVIRLAFELDR